jgi:hypothetical protein
MDEVSRHITCLGERAPDIPAREMEILLHRYAGPADLGLSRPLEGHPMRLEIGLAAFPVSLPAYRAEGQAVDEAGALMPVRPEHQGVDVMPPCQVIGRHVDP